MIGNPNLLIGNIALNLDRIKNAVAGNAAPSNHIKPTGSNPINIQAANASYQRIVDSDNSSDKQRMAHAIAQITATIIARITNPTLDNASDHITPDGSNPINIQAVNAKCQDQDPDCAIVIQRMAHAIAQITATIIARITNPTLDNASDHITPDGSNPINIQAVNAKCQDQDPDCAIVIQRMAHAIAQITATILATRNKQDRLFDSTQVAFILWDTLDQHVI